MAEKKWTNREIKGAARMGKCPFEMNVRLLLLENGMKMKDLDSETGMKCSSVLSYNNPQWSTVVTFAAALGVTPQDLVAEPEA